MRTALLAAPFLLPAVAAGQVTIGPDGVPRSPGGEPAAGQVIGAPEVVELIVSPAPLPDPPLRYRLTVPAAGRPPGSAASYWYRAELLLLEHDAGFTRVDPAAPGRADWAADRLGDPPADLTGKVLAAALGADPDDWPVLANCEAAARRGPADWGWGLDGMTGRDAAEILLPEIQRARSLGRLLALRGRSRAGAGDFDGALADARVGFKLASDLGEAPLLIADLVGVA